MKRRNLGPVLATLLILALLVTSCNQASSQVQDPDKLEGTVTISGAWALYPLMVRWGEEFQKLHPDVKFDISAGGAGKGMADALANAVDIGMVSREIYPEGFEGREICRMCRLQSWSWKPAVRG